MYLIYTNQEIDLVSLITETVVPFSANGLEGYLVSPEMYNRISNDPNYRTEEVQATPYDGVLSSRISYVNTAIAEDLVTPVTIEDKTIGNPGEIARILDKYLKGFVTGNIIVKYFPMTSGHVHEILPDGDLGIYIGTTTARENHISYVSSIFNYYSIGSWKLLSPNGIGEFIVDTRNARCVAELINNVLYIYFPAITSTLAEDYQPFESVIARLAKIIKEKKINTEKVYDFTEIEQLFTDNLLMGIREKKITIQTLSCRHRKLVDEIDTIREQLSMELDSLSHLEAKLDNIEDKLSSELAMLSRMDMINNVDVNGSVIAVDTSYIYANDIRTGLKHNLGEFRIYINLDSNSVTIFNKTRKVKAFDPRCQAPHVFRQGNCCFGSVTNTLENYISSVDILQTVMLLLAFLQSANVQDEAGMYVHRWPLDNETPEERVKRVRELEAKTTKLNHSIFGICDIYDETIFTMQEKKDIDNVDPDRVSYPEDGPEYEEEYDEETD